MNEKDFFKPFRIYELNYNRLMRWYLASLYSYNLTVESVDQNTSSEKRLDKVFYKDLHLIEHNSITLKKKYQKNYVSFLEEMTLIRIISILENFLIDVVRTSFYHDKTCFYEPKKAIEIQVSEFLSKSMEELEEKFIEEKVGNLHRQGFSEIKKFYSKALKVDFNNYMVSIDSDQYNIKDLNKIHDIRHLLVHRLGRTDEKYRRDYDYKRRFITLSEDEVILHLQIVNEFVEFLKISFKEKWFI